MQRPTRVRLATAGAVAALGVGGMVAVPALNGANGNKASASATYGAPGATAPGATARMQNHDQGRAAFEAALAKELGISVADLQAAQKKARAAVFVASLDEQVKSGRLTQDQADALKKAAADGTLEKVLKEQARARLEASLKGQVSAGLLTQAQADAILKRFDSAPADMGGPGAPGGPGGPGMGRGGHHGMGPGMMGRHGGMPGMHTP